LVNLAVSTFDRGGTTVVAVQGEIDVYTAPVLRDALDKQISAGKIDLVVDLRNVTFMDSTALGVLVGRLKLVRVQSGSLRVVVTHERVLRVFDITGLNKVFSIHTSVDEAVSASALGS
jgi:anti-sigma B factor antagonist